MEPAKTGAGPPSSPAATEADEFAALPRPRTRHPLLAVGAAALALFLVVKMRADIVYALSSGTPDVIGDVRSAVATERGRRVLTEGANRLVRISGTPDRESALNVDTKGSWTFTQFFRLLGTGSRVFVHRREDPLPGFRAERDVFEGRLMRFSDLSFEDAIRAYFAGHVSSTHFFRTDDIARIAAAGVDPARPAEVKDLAGDAVALGPNDILAVDLTHAGEIEVALPAARFPTPAKASEALVARGARILRPGRQVPDRQSWIIAVSAADRDGLLDRVGNIDWQSDIREVRETVKARLADLTAPGTPPALSVRGDGAGGPRPLAGIRSIRTLSTVQIPSDALLIVEADVPRAHLPRLAIAAVLLVFAVFNVMGLLRGLRR